MDYHEYKANCVQAFVAFSVIWPDERKNFKTGEVIKIKEMRK